MALLAQDELAQTGILSGPDSSRHFPDWFIEDQRLAWEEFQRLPTPTRNDQPWRFSNVKLLDLSAFKRSAPVPEELRLQILEESRALSEVAGRLVFAGDELV